MRTFNSFLCTLALIGLLGRSSQAQVSVDYYAGGAMRVGPSTTTCDAAAEGAIRYNSTSKVMEYCNATIWTEMNAADYAPTLPYSFTNVNTQNTNTVTISEIIPTPVSIGQTISISGGYSPQYRICADSTCSTNPSWTSSSGTTQRGEYIQLRQTSRGSLGQMSSATLDIGGVQTTWDVTVSTGTSSCLDILQSGNSTGNGVYTIDPDGAGGNASFSAYCNMTTDGGGWTMVVAQYENDPVTNWNEGIQGDYDPTLVTNKGFALSTAQIPTHTYTGFGKDFDPTFVDYATYTYTTGDIAITALVGIKTGDNYHIYREANLYHSYHDPEDPATGNTSDWSNTLTFDKFGGHEFDWAFSPQQPTIIYRGFAMKGVLIYLSAESYAWTVWVK